MGFDNECIINIQSLAGEYFCPVCRLLVYPNEALQSQCTHLYCKPCLQYVVSTTKACPYDGYLVTEADSKPLVESNKALADTIGKLAVHCLYHRSGCTWQGPLSDCISHCSSCTFGNSPVVCNRCGIQIVHRQVQEHAQSCPGVPSQAQQPTAVQDVVATVSSAPPSDQNQIIQAGATAQIPHGPAGGPVPDTSQHSAPAQAHPIGPATTAPTPEQWYQQQQQYQQYYQQYPGYDPYQQQYQQYYPYQQQPGQQYPPQQQILQPQQSAVPGQVPPQMYPQQQPQNQPPMQPQPQPQFPLQPPLQPQSQQPMQAPFPPQNQKLVQPNLQQQLTPVVQPHPHGQFPPPSQPYPQMLPQPVSAAQPHPVQLPQTQPPPQAQFPQNYPNVQSQYPPQQAQPRPLSQSGQQHQLPNSQSLAQHPSALAVTGNQSYPQSQPHQQLQPGVVQPHHGNVQVQGGSLQNPQPHPQVRPQQHPNLFPSMGQAQVAPAYLQMQQPTQQRPTVQSGQQLPLQFLQQHPQTLPGQPPNMTSNQPQQQAHVQQSHQQHIPRPQGPPYTGQLPAYPQPQQDSVLSGMQHQQMPQNQAVRPLIPDPGLQAYPPSNAGNTPLGGPSMRPSQSGMGQLASNQNYASRNNHLPSASEQHIGYIQPDLQFDPASSIKPPVHDIQHGVVSMKAPSESEADMSLKKSGVSNDATGAVASNNNNITEVQVKHSESVLNVEEKASSYKVNNQMEKQDHPSTSVLVPATAADPLVAEDKSDNYSNRVKQSSNSGLENDEKLPDPPLKDSSSIKYDFTDANGKIQGDNADGGSHTVQIKKDVAVIEAPISEVGKALAAPSRDVPQVKDRNITESHSSLQGNIGEGYRGFHSSADMQVRGTVQPSHHHIADMGPNNPQMIRPGLPQQRPGAPFVPQQAFPPGSFNPSQIPEFLPPPPPPPPSFPQGPGMFPLQGPPLAPEILPQPSMNQPRGFPAEVPPGGMMGMPFTGQYGPAPNQFGPGDRNIDPQFAATHGHYNRGNFPPPNAGGKIPQGEYGVNPVVAAPTPGSFDPSSGMFPPRGPLNHTPHYRPPSIPTENEIFSGQRPNFIDARPPGVHSFGTSDHVPFDPRHMMQQPNLGKMNGFHGLDSPSTLGIKNDRFNQPMENVNPFMVEPNVRAPDRRIFEEDLKLFPRYPESRHGDGGQSDASLRSFDRDFKGFHDDSARRFDNGAQKFLPPFPVGGVQYPNDCREGIDPYGFHDDSRQRVDLRSPTGEFSRGFGGFSGPSMNRPGRGDVDGMESRTFGGISKPFDLPLDRSGTAFNDNQYPAFSNNPHRGDLDTPGNFRMGEQIVGSGAMLGQDLLSNNHHRFGDPAKFGAFPPLGFSHDEPGSGKFSQIPFGESIRTGNMPSHPRIGEPGFRSRYSLPAFPKDGGFHPGDIDSFDNSRKRMQPRVGWCRICKVDCETVEGLDLHSQTSEHQKMAMDMVLNIKLQNSRKMKASNDSHVINSGLDNRNN